MRAAPKLSTNLLFQPKTSSVAQDEGEQTTARGNKQWLEGRLKMEKKNY